MGNKIRNNRKRSAARSQVRRAPRLPGLRKVYDAVIAGCADLEAVTEALDAELWLAANVCVLRDKAPDDEAFRLAMLDVIDEAERDGRRQCLLLLRTMAAVGPQGLVDQAARAAERLAGRTTPEEGGTPDWVDALGETAAVGDCCVWTDVFAEYTYVYCEYVHAGGGRRHGLQFTIDLAFHGVLNGIDVVTEPTELDRTIPNMQRDARREGGQFLRVPPADAAGLLRAALIASADPALPPLLTASRDKSLAEFLPLAVRRVMAMPGEQSSDPPRGQVSAAWPARRRQALVEEFLDAHPDGWVDAAVARMIAARIVDASVDVLGFPPDRMGPASVARLFGEYLPTAVVIPRSLLDDVMHVARAWVRWRTDAQDLPRAARRQLRRTANAVLAVLPTLSRSPRLNPTVPYLTDAPAAARADGDALQEIMYRRAFAVPIPGQRGDGVVDLPEPANGLPAGQTHVDKLDPADPAHRHLITAIGQAAEGTHTRRIPAHAAVVEQLWNDQPAAVWQAARRLTAAGLPRQRVLDRLAATWQRDGSDTERYTAALSTLGSAASSPVHR